MFVNIRPILIIWRINTNKKDTETFLQFTHPVSFPVLNFLPEGYSQDGKEKI